jgi:hypothetical protein
VDIPGHKTIGTIAVISALVFVVLDSAFQTIQQGTLTLSGGFQPLKK